MQLTTEVITHAIITFTKSHHLINAKQHEALKSLSLDGTITINGSTLRGSNIAEIIPISKYYETYPDKRPAPTQDFKQPYESPIKRAMNDTRALEQMIKGYRKVKTTGHILEQMEARLAAIKAGRPTKSIDYINN